MVMLLNWLGASVPVLIVYVVFNVNPPLAIVLTVAGVLAKFTVLQP